MTGTNSNLQASATEAVGASEPPAAAATATLSAWSPDSSRTLWILGFLAVFITRLPASYAKLYSFDSVNLAYALREFDPTRNQPQPPGYPVFVMLARSLQIGRAHV